MVMDVWGVPLPGNSDIPHPKKKPRLVGGNGDALTGNVTSLRALKDTLEKVRIWSCPNLVGSFMDLADFPRLKRLNFDGTAVTGDIRDIREHDYSVFERRPWPPKDCRWW
jgi:hypothetical protein